MTDANGQQLTLDADVLEGTSDGLQITYQTDDGQTVTTLASDTDAADIVSKAFTTVADGSEANFTTVADGSEANFTSVAEVSEANFTTIADVSEANYTTIADGSEVNYTTVDDGSEANYTTVVDGSQENIEYTTMTPEEAAAAGVIIAPEDEQVVTTSLQFDPANPSVLYTADGTPINQADLTPEEQALVQAALQQHLAEQEAEQQLAMMQEGAEIHGNTEQGAMELSEVDGNVVTSTSLTDQHLVASSTDQIISSGASIVATAAEAIVGTTIADATVTSTVESAFTILSDGGIDLASPNTSASQIVQSLADNVRKQQLEDKLRIDSKFGDQLKAGNTNAQAAAALTSGANQIKYAEKIVLRQGQPQVVKIPVVNKMKPEIPAALANLMPKVEVGKDGSQVIRIHQSQITQNQLKALQDNPNVRLVFRPASSTRAKPPVPVHTMSSMPKKRGRPRKPQNEPTAKISLDNFMKLDTQEDEDDPPTKTTRCGRLSKRPVYTKDYLTPKVTKELEDDQILDPGDEMFKPNSSSPPSEKKGRGRPIGSKNYKRSNSYASKIEALRVQPDSESSIPVQSNKPALTPIEQALSTRRKNRLREMLGACSEDEIMEVALPHLARVFSLWEFLVTKVEKNKMARVFFADVYKEYECLHKYVSKLAEKYKQAIEAKATSETSEATTSGAQEGEVGEGLNGIAEGNMEERKSSKLVHVTYTKLAESLGLVGTTLQEAEISLLDPEEAIGPRIMGLTGGSRRGGWKYSEDQSMRKPKAHIASTGLVKNDIYKPKATVEAAKPIQTEATSTISTLTSLTQNAAMPSLKPLGQTTKVVTPETTTVTEPAPVNGTIIDDISIQPEALNTETPMEVDTTTIPTTVAAPDTGTMAEQVADAEPSTEGTGTQLIQIGEGDEQQYIEVPEGYTLIQTPEGLVMSQPGTTISQGDDGNIYITHADGTTTPLNVANQEGVSMETVESLLSLDGQQQPQT